MPGPAFRRNETVGLHTVEAGDLEFLQALHNDPAVRLGMPFTDPENARATEEWFEERVSDTDECEGVQFLVCPRSAPDGDAVADGGPPTFASTDSDEPAADGDEAEGADGPTPVGFVALREIERPAGRADLLAYFHPRYQGRGYATAATRELVAYGIEERRLNRIAAGVLATNDAARAVLERVGLTREETQRRERRVDGEFVDVVRYAMLAEEWFSRPDTTRGIPDSPPGATAEARGLGNPFAVDDGADGAGNGGER